MLPAAPAATRNPVNFKRTVETADEPTSAAGAAIKTNGRKRTQRPQGIHLFLLLPCTAIRPNQTFSRRFFDHGWSWIRKQLGASVFNPCTPWLIWLRLAALCSLAAQILPRKQNLAGGSTDKKESLKKIAEPARTVRAIAVR